MLKTQSVTYVDFLSQKILSNTSLDDQISVISKSLHENLDGKNIAYIQPAINYVLSEIEKKNLTELTLKEVNLNSTNAILSSFFKDEDYIFFTSDLHIINDNAVPQEDKYYQKNFIKDSPKSESIHDFRIISNRDLSIKQFQKIIESDHLSGKITLVNPKQNLILRISKEMPAINLFETTRNLKQR